MTICYYDTRNEDTELHNETCAILDKAIKAARTKAEKKYKLTIKKMMVHFDSTTKTCEVNFDNQLKFETDYNDISEFEENIYLLFSMWQMSNNSSTEKVRKKLPPEQ